MFIEGEDDCPGSPVIPDQSFNCDRSASGGRHARFLVSVHVLAKQLQFAGHCVLSYVPRKQLAVSYAVWVAMSSCAPNSLLKQH